MAARDRRIFQSLARKMQAAGVRPNWVSLASVIFIILGAAWLVASHHSPTLPATVGLFAFPIFIGLRAVCNLLDGMIAIEGGAQTASGEIFNDFPDRLSDPIMIVAVGYAAIESELAVPLGWLAAVISILVAYARMIGSAAGAASYFIGPMAKTHRMLLIALASWSAAIERIYNDSTWCLVAGLIIICIGGVITIARRLRRIVCELESA